MFAKDKVDELFIHWSVTHSFVPCPRAGLPSLTVFQRLSENYLTRLSQKETGDIIRNIVAAVRDGRPVDAPQLPTVLQNAGNDKPGKPNQPDYPASSLIMTTCMAISFGPKPHARLNLSIRGLFCAFLIASLSSIHMVRLWFGP